MFDGIRNKSTNFYISTMFCSFCLVLCACFGLSGFLYGTDLTDSVRIAVCGLLMFFLLGFLLYGYIDGID
jgi:tRNA(Arg) A34 adenosine deaminase TadA